MIRRVLLSLALVLALGLQLVSWTDLTTDTASLLVAVLCLLLVAVVGTVLRELGVRAAAVAWSQAGAVVLLAGAGTAAVHGIDPLLDLPATLGDTVTLVATSTVPLAPDAGLTLAALLVIGLAAVFADALAVGADRVGWAVLPVVLIQLVPAVALAAPLLPRELAALGLGIGLVLFAGSSAFGRTFGVRLTAALGALAVTAASVGLAWISSESLPSFEIRRNTAPIQMSDPSLDLKRNLVEATDQPILSYTTDRSNGAYLRLASLPVFSSAGFGLREVQVATGRLPRPPGLTQGGAQRTTDVTITAFASEWLPVPYAPTRVDAEGEWGFALGSLEVMALAGPERTSATLGLSYRVQSLDVAPSDDQIAQATSAAVDQDPDYTALVDDLPQRVGDLARDVTADASTAGQQALALEAYLTSGAFTYSTAPGVGVGDGVATIDDFLFGSRTGYCEQFAGAMAIMARELGIPSRIAVGFTPGTFDGTAWQVTGRDMHAWPELWLEGWGWVAFEPTPARDGSSPDTTGDGATAEPTPGEEATDSAAPTAEPLPVEPLPTMAPTQTPETPGASADQSWLAWVVAAGLIVLSGAAAIAVPRILRARRRSVRLAGTGDPRDDALAAWEEVREAARDARIPWPDGSPRFAAARFSDALGDDPRARDALARLALSVERALYDDPGRYNGPDSWVDEVHGIENALAAHRQEERAARRR